MLRLPLVLWKMKWPAGTAHPPMTLCNFIKLPAGFFYASQSTNRTINKTIAAVANR
jgi:hypothetical protein